MSKVSVKSWGTHILQDTVPKHKKSIRQYNHCYITWYICCFLCYRYHFVRDVERYWFPITVSWYKNLSEFRKGEYMLTVKLCSFVYFILCLLISRAYRQTKLVHSGCIMCSLVCPLQDYIRRNIVLLLLTLTIFP